MGSRVPTRVVGGLPVDVEKRPVSVPRSFCAPVVVACLAVFGLVSSSEAVEPALLQNGDIILHQSQSSQSEALRAATGSPYTHVGLVFFRDRQPYVLEAVQPVKWTPLDSWEARGRDGKVVVVRHDPPLSEEQAKNLRAEAETYLGRPYDVLFQWSDEHIYCSELVYKAYRDALHLEAGVLTPLRSQELDHPAVQALIAKRGVQHLDVDELIVTPASLLTTPGFRVVVSTDPGIDVGSAVP